MQRTIYLLLLALPLVPFTATAATPSSDPDCESAKPPKEDFATHWATCRARAAAARASSGQFAATAATDTVESTMTKVSTLVTEAIYNSVPTWSDADILAQFPLQRDVRYMTVASNPSFLRRISWMYPDDGCFTRAEQFDVKVAQAGKTRPYKLFAFGNNLHVSTTNASLGYVEWIYHVVAAVKNSAGELIVFDGALSPCKPLPWKTWLALMASDVSVFDTQGTSFFVSLGDSNAYVPTSLVTNEPSHATDSLNGQQNTWLPNEWSRQVDLSRDPNVVLGASPPWSGFACVNTEVVQVTTTLAPNTSGTATATCPFATLVVGGGLAVNSSFAVSKNAKSGNGWQITARNNSGSSAGFNATAVCLTGAPTNASVTTANGNVVSVNSGSFATSTATCTSGTLVGGGFSTTQGATSVMRIFSNQRTTSTGNSWQASAQNTTFSAKNVQAFAYCLANTSFTINQISVVEDSGVGFIQCSPKNSVGGGFAFPRTASYSVDTMYALGTQIYVVDMSGIPSSGDPNAKGFAECLAHP